MFDLFPTLVPIAPMMLFLGVRHALDADHISCIDNLVRLNLHRKGTGWIGAGFSIGHTAAVTGELILFIYTASSFLDVESFTFWGGLVGASVLVAIGIFNFYTIKKWKKTSLALLAGGALSKTKMRGPLFSSILMGLVFGLSFETATQIAAIVLATAASATLGLEVGLISVTIFALGMVTVDTLNSFFLKSRFSKMLNRKGFRVFSYGLSTSALLIGILTALDLLFNRNLLPVWAGPALATLILASAFGYSYTGKSFKIK